MEKRLLTDTLQQSHHKRGIRIDIQNGRPHKLADVFEEKASYHPMVEVIVQEIQFTNMPAVEKKTTEIGSTG